MVKMGMATQTLPLRSPALMRMLAMEMNWIILTSEVTQRAMMRLMMEP